MAGKRDFSTVPVRIFNDPRPSALDFRTLACVSMHDGMSLKKGTGRGCYATFATLTASIGCDASNLSKSLKRLVEWGYLSEERQDDRRRKTYRVIFDAAESWRNDQQSGAGEVGETANDPAEIVGRDESGNGSYPPQDEQHYSSLKGLDTLEREKLDSSEDARFAARRLSKMGFADNVGAQLAAFERAWSTDPDQFDLPTLEQWEAYFDQVHEAFECGDPEHGRAQRLSEEIYGPLEELRNGRACPVSPEQIADLVRSVGNAKRVRG